jgi:hypothetical protein
VGHSEYDVVMFYWQCGSHQVIYPNGLFGDLALRAGPPGQCLSPQLL